MWTSGPPPSVKRPRLARRSFSAYWAEMGMLEGVLYRGCYGHYFHPRTTRCVVCLQDGVLHSAIAIDHGLSRVTTDVPPSRLNKRTNTLRPSAELRLPSRDV